MALDFKSRINKIKEGWKKKGHKKVYSFIIAGIMVVVMFFTWLFGTNTGWIARTSWEKTFDTESYHLVTVYSADGATIRHYEGTYNVEDRGKYWIIMNVNTGERINVYGDSMIIIDEPPRDKIDGEQGE